MSKTGRLGMRLFVGYLVALTAILALGCSGAQPEQAGNADAATADGADAADGAEGAAETAALAGADAPRGLITNTEAAAAGYVFFSPLLSDTTYLIDSDGQVVHTWKSGYAPSGWVYLLDDGHLMRGGREPEVARFGGGGQGGRIQEFSWDGELLWDFVFASEDHLLHHDVAVLPNGNVLAIAWENRTVEEVQRAGRRPDLTPEVGLWPDMIVEFEPQRPNGARIVWEWHMWDHLIQNYDPDLPNYGDPAEHPELIDVNADREPVEISEEELERLKALGYVPPDVTTEDVGADYLHTNAVAYNAALDQIVVSVPRFNEIWVIDHSTTSAEATGHSGGRWGRGGDLLYRWGSPQTYRRGDETQQRLFAQHDVRWVPAGLPGAGNLIVFSNDMSGPEGDYSAVFEIVLPTESDGRYVTATDGPLGPPEPVWSYVAPDKVSFFAPFISGAHRMTNGHTLITSGPQGRFFEVTAEGAIVWEYWTPYSGEVRMPDGSTPHPVGEFTYAVFRATKIPPDHPALAGRDLTPLDPQPEIVAPPPPPEPAINRP